MVPGDTLWRLLDYLESSFRTRSDCWLLFSWVMLAGITIALIYSGFMKCKMLRYSNMLWYFLTWQELHICTQSCWRVDSHATLLSSNCASMLHSDCCKLVCHSLTYSQQDQHHIWWSLTSSLVSELDRRAVDPVRKNNVYRVHSWCAKLYCFCRKLHALVDIMSCDEQLSEAVQASYRPGMLVTNNVFTCLWVRLSLCQADSQACLVSL